MTHFSRSIWLLPIDPPKRWTEALLTSVCLTLIYLAFSVQPASGQTIVGIGSRSLQGLDGVEVEVTVETDARKAGLSEATLESNAEFQLRRAGIEVYTEEERRNTSAAPILSVTIGSYYYDGNLAVSVSSKLKQRVYTTADDQLTGSRVTGYTWKATGLTGMVSTNNVQSLNKYPRQMVDAFIKDWLAVH